MSFLFALFTARLPRAAPAARWTSTSELCSSKRIGSKVSRLTALMHFSVISAKAKAALRCSSRLSEYTRVVRADKGPLLKKSTSSLYRVLAFNMTRSQGIHSHCLDSAARGRPLPARFLAAFWDTVPLDCFRCTNYSILPLSLNCDVGCVQAAVLI